MSEITEAELFREIERMKVKQTRGLTELQYECLCRARSEPNPISWGDLAAWYNQKFGTNFTRKQLANRFENAKNFGHRLPA